MGRRGLQAVAFDFDGVLFDGYSWLALTEGLGCSVETHAELYRRAIKGELNWAQVLRELVAMYQAGGNTTRDFIAKLCTSLQLRPETVGVVGHLRSKGYKLCLISGSFDLQIEMAAKRLGVEHRYSWATLIFDQEERLEAIVHRGDQNQLKVRQLVKFCQKVGISPTECVFVGDSYNDIGVFQLTSHGVAVYCDDERLKRLAWRECETLKEVKEIL